MARTGQVFDAPVGLGRCYSNAMTNPVRRSFEIAFQVGTLVGVFATASMLLMNLREVSPFRLGPAVGGAVTLLVLIACLISFQPARRERPQ
jgi:hypothetical protein